MRTRASTRSTATSRSRNPHKVPSIMHRGTREPICLDCVERANPKRIENGLDPIVVLPGAYEPISEGEL